MSKRTRPSSHEEVLLSPASVDQRSIECQVAGRPSTLVLRADGSVLIKQGEATCTGCLSCFGGSSTPAEIRAADVVGVSQESGNAIRIWYMPAPSPKAEKPTRKLHKTALIKLPNRQDAEAVANELRAACCWGGKPDPPRLLVIINPASGPGRGPSIYEKQVLPVLEAAGLTRGEHLTKHRGHATEILSRTAPGEYDVVVSIGGDGTMYEVVQGMLNRPDWDHLRRMPLVQVPCGSGNALAASTGLWDASTAAHAIVKGATQALDIVSVLQPPGRRYYSFLSINFGLITNLDIGTEHLRWMGGTRFIVGALQQILFNRSHHARVAILEADVAAAASSAASTAAGGAAEAAAAPGGTAAGGTDGLGGAAAAAAGGSKAAGSKKEACKSGCSAPGSTDGERVAGPDFDWSKVESALAVGPPLHHTKEFHLLADHARLDDLTLPPGWRWLPSPAVQLFTASNLPRLDMNFLLVPDAQLDSGHINLVYTPAAGTSRRKGFELLSASEKGRHMHLVEQHRIVALALEPVTTGTWLVVDGEEVPYQTIFLEVLPSLCRVVVAPPR